jgi:type II secretory ATPase GspE/PulE/Tfp pilus assembly ATPase PilB-like protein
MAEGQQRVIQNVVSSYNRDQKEKETGERAASLGLPYYDVRRLELAPDNLSLISVQEAQMGILPLFKKGDALIVGVAEPNGKSIVPVLDYLSQFFKIQQALITWDAVKDALPRYEGLARQSLDEERDYEIELAEASMTFKELEAQLNSASLRDVLKFILSAAIHANSSDIHLEPQREGCRIRFRIDGVLHVVGVLKRDRYEYVLSQIELASGMKLNVNEAQEGRLEIDLRNSTVNVRVETMPTLYGDDVALRLFNTQATMLELKDLGLSDYNRAIIDELLARPQGMVLVVGPTGAGKTTTIYAILNRLNEPGFKIITLEDPIEYALPGIAQSQINEGGTFSERLMAVLREDPDIIMVGEIRDAETAGVALHAALTGHLMVSTFHANNAATAIGLLKEITENSTLLASGINLIVAQRLVRRLCDKCKKVSSPSPEIYQFATQVFESIPEGLRTGKQLAFYEPVGCDACNGLGYTGRVGIFELLPLSVEMQKLINREDVTVAEIQEAALQTGMVSMEQDGILKVIDGITSIEEVARAVKE